MDDGKSGLILGYSILHLLSSILEFRVSVVKKN
jgi:hypothetical protein